MRALKTILIRLLPLSLIRFIHKLSLARLSQYWSHRLGTAFDRTVTRGFFEGMSLPERSEWSGPTDFVPKLFGTYEEHLFTWLRPPEESGNKWPYFVNIGAAEGYWLIGAMLCKWADECIAYERSAASRAIMARASEQNGVSIDVRGNFDKSEVTKLFHELSKESGLFLIDIEGDEFDGNVQQLVNALTNFTFVIELHAALDSPQVTRLIQSCSETHNVKPVRRDMRTDIHLDATILKEAVPEWEELALLSEGRPFPQNWVVLSPKRY